MGTLYSVRQMKEMLGTVVYDVSMFYLYFGALHTSDGVRIMNSKFLPK